MDRPTPPEPSPVAPHPLQGQYAIVEIMGHRKIAGRISEVTFAGAPLLCVTVPAMPAIPASMRWHRDWKKRVDGKYVRPETPADPERQEFFGGAAIFSIRPCSQEAAVAVAQEQRDVPGEEWRDLTDEDRAHLIGEGVAVAEPDVEEETRRLLPPFIHPGDDEDEDREDEGC